MSAGARPIHLPGAKALEWLRQRAHAALEAWGRDWVSGWADIEAQLVRPHIRGAHESSRAEAQECEAIRSDAGCVWFRRSAVDRSRFCRAVVGAELMPRSICADDWIAAITEQAWDARNRALCAALLGAADAELQAAANSDLPPELFALGSGAVEISCDMLGLHAVTDGSIWRSAPPTERAAQQLAKLAPLERAAQDAVLRLDVVLGSVDLELPNVLDLRRGDVLRLPQRLDQPLLVLCEGKPMARATFGETHGRKSIRILTNHRCATS